MIDTKKTQALVEALNLVIPPAELPADAQARRVAWIITMSLPGMPPEVLQEAVKTLAEKPEILAGLQKKALDLQVQQSVISRAWNRIVANIPW